MLDQIWGFSENKDGTIWTATQSGIVYLVTPSYKEDGEPLLNNFKLEKYGAEQGLKFASGLVFNVAGETFFPADSCIYRFVWAEKKFVPDYRVGHLPKHGGLDEFFIIEDSECWIILDFGKDKRIATPQADGSYKLDTTTLLPISDNLVNFTYPEKNGVIWFGTTDGLIRFDDPQQKTI